MKTLEAFTSDDLELRELEKLPSLNGFRFSDLPESQQRKLKTRALRVIVLDDTTTEDTRQAIFDRINTSPLRAKGAEIRRGTFAGPFTKFLLTCADNALFGKLCPISPMLRARRENEEVVLRFFAYSDKYRHFKHDVEKFLDDFLKSHRDNFPETKMAAEFDAMLRFVQAFFPHGFAKTPGAKSTPRVRFEAIAVGVNLALRKSPKLSPPPVSSWIESEDFERHTTTHASNSGPRLRGRVEFVRDKLLGR